jgi:hypothetical protein
VKGEADANLNTPIVEVMLQTIHSISRDREGVGSLRYNFEGLLNVEASIEIELEVAAVKVQSYRLSFFILDFSFSFSLL